MKRTAAVIVTYNRAEKLRHCLDAVIAQDASEAPDIIVVDNHSSDHTAECVHSFTDGRQSGPAVHYFDTGHNAGGAGGFAFGITRAEELGYDYVWLMDDDCVPKPSALRRLYEADRALGGDYGFLSSRVLWKDGTLCAMNIQRRTLARKVKRAALQEARTGEVIPAAMASFVSLFVPVKIVRQHGLPIREFFVWTDDWEFTRRISRSHPCYVVPGSVVVHDTQANSGADIASAPADRTDRFKYLYRNDVYLYRREGLKGLAYETVRLTWHMVKIACSRRKLRDKAERAGILLKGTAQGLRFNPVPERLPASGEQRSEIRVLEAFGEPISFGGQEAFVMNVLEHMDRTGMKIDLLSPYFCDNDRTVSVIHGYGGEVYALNCPFKPGSLRRQAVLPLSRFFKEHQYDVVHIHSGSNIMLAMLAVCAARGGSRRVIVHSHSTGISGWKHSASKIATAPMLRRYPTEYCACSEEAGQWRFPADICRKKLRVVYNGIEAENFRYDEALREEMRRSLGIDDQTVVIGNVGRLVYQKNQVFLLEIMREILTGKQDRRYQLLLVGSGTDMLMLKERAAELGIEDDIIFTGARNNVADYYQAIDVLAVPSHYEGLGMVVIEGQAAGLDVLVSDRVPRIAAVTDAVEYIPLEERETWADRITAGHSRHPENVLAIMNSPYSADYTARVVRAMYTGETGDMNGE